MALRLMRNIVCHERSFSFAFTAELISVSLRLFRTTANFERIIDLYRSCCFTSLPALLASESLSVNSTSRRRASSLLRLQPVASIQLQNPASCALLLSPHLKLAQIVLGADTLCRWAKAIKETSRSKDACVTALVGENRSGRTTAALFIAAVMSCAAGVPSFGTARRRRSAAPELRVSSGTVIYVPLSVVNWKSMPVGSIVARLESLIAVAALEQANADLASLIERGQASDGQVVIICDDVDSVFAVCTSLEHAQELRLALASFFITLQPAVSFIVTGSSSFIDTKVRTDWPFVRSFPLNALAARESLVSDAQLLIRHYYRT